MPSLAPRVPSPEHASEADLVGSLVEMVEHPDYPCLGARSVVHRSRAFVHVYPELGTAATAAQLLDDLAEFARGIDLGEGFASFVAVFRGPRVRDEAHFERVLWAQLRALHEQDVQPWAQGVSADPADPHFAFSAGGTAYFVVGLHPEASRTARRAAVPTLVFNLHEQFEQLRAEGRFPPMRERIRARDARLQGDVNPMVGDHGEASEARQYSGRAVGPEWRAPFRWDPATVAAPAEPPAKGRVGGPGPDRGTGR